MGKPKSCLRILGVLWIILFCLLTIMLARPALHLYLTWKHDVRTTAPAPPHTHNDASHLNETTVSETVKIPSDRQTAEEQVRALLRRANDEGLAISIAGARHTMGGHTLYPGGIALDMLPFNHLELDENSNILTAGAGARWSEIIPFLHARGRSVSVMQSNNNFSVGGSISANCHGWQSHMPPVCSTVDSFRLMKADGSITTCSRTENQELFSLVLGGYGLFGVILDVRLHVVPDEMMRLERIAVPLEEFASAHASATTSGTDAVMVYGRLDITPEHFLDNARLNIWHRDSASTCTTGSLASNPVPGILRTIFRGSVGSAYGKELRWFAESRLEPLVGSETASRSSLQNVSADWFENHSPSDTDILHEYFVPPEQFAPFIARARTIITEEKADLLNVTVRDVQVDSDSFLKYADKPMLCLVMLFNQQKTSEAERTMRDMTRKLIDAALDCNGRYYLPYRLHATSEQLRRAYPMVDEFVAMKKQYDPNEIFRNRLYESLLR